MNCIVSKFGFAPRENKNNSLEVKKGFSKEGVYSMDDELKAQKEKILKTDIGKYLAQVGFFKLEDKIQEVLSDIRNHARNTIAQNESEDILGYDTSCMHIDEYSTKKNISKDSYHVAIDVGGSHTKVIISDNGKLYQLFDKENYELMGGDKPNPKSQNGALLKHFISNVVKEIKTELPRLKNYNEDKVVGGVAIVWSNAIDSHTASEKNDGYEGIGGKTKGIENGVFYKKGEPFLDGLKDGFDVSKAFHEAFQSEFKDEDINVLIANDTIYTLKALDGAVGGVVMSTGGNFTLSDKNGIIYNTEGGATFHIKDDFLTKFEQSFKEQHHKKNEFTVPSQFVGAGKWLGKLAEEYIQGCYESGNKKFENLAKKIDEYYEKEGGREDKNSESYYKGGYVTNGCATRNGDFLSASKEYTAFLADNIDIRQELQSLGLALVRRASFICALYSIASAEGARLGEDGKLKVSLDSSILRYADFENEFKEIVSSLSDEKVDVTLVRPIKCEEGKDISVPLQGAIKAISSY